MRQMAGPAAYAIAAVSGLRVRCTAAPSRDDAPGPYLATLDDVTQ